MCIIIVNNLYNFVTFCCYELNLGHVYICWFDKNYPFYRKNIYDQLNKCYSININTVVYKTVVLILATVGYSSELVSLAV